MNLNVVSGHCSPAVIVSIMKCNLSSHCASQKTKKSLLEKERENEALAFCVFFSKVNQISSEPPGQVLM